jgi:hypothetical protein
MKVRKQAGILKMILMAKGKRSLFLIQYGGGCILTTLSGGDDGMAQAIFLHKQSKARGGVAS